MSVTEAKKAASESFALIESSLAALRGNVHSTLNTNAKIIASWKEFVHRFGPAAK